MATFMDKVQENLDNTSYTENGAKGYKSTGSDLVDFFYKVSSFRNMSEEDIIKEFDKIKDNPNTLRLLFYIRDPRNGLGERRLFRICMKHLLSDDHFQEGWKDPLLFQYLLMKVYKYGRADDMYYVFDFDDMQYNTWFKQFICKNISEDLKAMEENKPITLLAKWLPSENASSELTKQLATMTRHMLGMTSKEYRQTLSKLRKYIDVTERKMCARDWSEIDYSKVPSKANLLYSNAFMKHDEERRTEFLNKLKSGDKSVHINSEVNYPHDIVHKYMSDSYWCRLKDYDETLEQLWKALKPVDGIKDTLVVRDGSGSMSDSVGNTAITALDVATALAIYCSQYCSSAYKNKFITFSTNPRFVNLTTCKNLHDKLVKTYKEDECSTTAIEKVFDLILEVAVHHNLKQKALPKQILIISDMEFNQGTNYTGNPIQAAQEKFAQHGYKVPRLVFWNVLSRTCTVPIKENDLGVTLVSGFSQNVLNLVMNGDTDTLKALLKELDKYEEIPLI